MPRAPVLSIAHGGGPLPVIGDPSQAAIAHSLRTRVPKILKTDSSSSKQADGGITGSEEAAPEAIIVVTAHWSTPQVRISSAARHELYYDYSGFPRKTYELKYPAPGSPKVAEEVAKALAKEGIASKMDSHRGWDHGVFVPLLLIHPAADIPIVQVSVLDSEDPASLLAVGRALAPLRDRNIAILASGSASFHNLRLMMGAGAGQPALRRLLTRWGRRLDDAVTERDPAARAEKLVGWRGWEGSYDVHPRGGAEHFSPLLVAAGAAGEGVAKSYRDDMMGTDMTTYYWE